MGSSCAKRASSNASIEAIMMHDVFYEPSEHGWEQTSMFKMGHTHGNTVWWGTWKWAGWVTQI